MGHRAERGGHGPDRCEPVSTQDCSACSCTYMLAVLCMLTCILTPMLDRPLLEDGAFGTPNLAFRSASSMALRTATLDLTCTRNTGGKWEGGICLPWAWTA